MPRGDAWSPACICAVDRRVVETYLVVQMGTVGAAFAADIAADLAAVHVLAGGDGESGEVAVQRMKSNCYVAEGVRVVRGNNLTGGRDNTPSCQFPITVLTRLFCN